MDDCALVRQSACANTLTAMSLPDRVARPGVRAGDPVTPPQIGPADPRSAGGWAAASDEPGRPVQQTTSTLPGAFQVGGVDDESATQHRRGPGTSAMVAMRPAVNDSAVATVNPRLRSRDDSRQRSQSRSRAKAPQVSVQLSDGSGNPRVLDAVTTVTATASRTSGMVIQSVRSGGRARTMAWPGLQHGLELAALEASTTARRARTIRQTVIPARARHDHDFHHHRSPRMFR